MLRFVAWRRRHVAPGIMLMVLSVLTGVICGIAAWILKFCIGHMCRFFLGFVDPQGPNWYLAVLPFIGILLTGIYQRYIIHFDLEDGTRRISEALAAKKYYMSFPLCYRPLVGNIVTLGLGGSAGAEGPIASAGAAIGSNVARLFGAPPGLVRVMIGCGAGAGIAGIFKAPIGGALFTLEVLKMRISTLSVLALTVAAVCGGMTCYALTGFTFDVVFLPTAFFDPHTLGWVMLLGVFCGLYSVYYNRVTKMLHRFFRSFRNPWLKNLTGAAVVGACLLIFPAMYGDGYKAVTDLVNGRSEMFLSGGIFSGLATRGTVMLMLMALLMLVLKVFATISTNSSGGVAGDFAPTIFAGAFAGLLFALIVNKVFDANVPVALFALFGTAGAFAGIIHAPIMAMFLVAEMLGNGYGYFLPLMFTASISYITVKLVTPLSQYANANHDDLTALLHIRHNARQKEQSR